MGDNKMLCPLSMIGSDPKVCVSSQCMFWDPIELKNCGFVEFFLFFPLFYSVKEEDSKIDEKNEKSYS